MYKKISEMTAEDKTIFLERTKQAMRIEQRTSWELIEQKLIEEM